MNMLKFNGTTKAHFTVTDEDIRETHYRNCETYADSHPILRVLQPYLYDFIPLTEWNGVSLDTDDGCIEPVKFSREVENWLQAAHEGKAGGPVQFAIFRWNWSTFTIEIDWTEDFVCEHHGTGDYWDNVSDLADDVGIPVNDMYGLLQSARETRIELRPAGEDYPDEEPLTYDHAVYRTTD